jgi:hypothetical protein
MRANAFPTGGIQKPAIGSAAWPRCGRRRRGGRSIPVRSGRGGRRRAGAARRAAEFGRREVDTEHLLLALTESDVVRTILDQFKVSLDDLRRQLEQETPRGEAPAREQDEERRDRRLAAGQGRARPRLRRLARASAIPMSGPSTS